MGSGTKMTDDASADRAEWADGFGVAEFGEEDGAIAVEEGDVPLDFDAEALVLVAAYRVVRAKQNREIDIGFVSDRRF